MPKGSRPIRAELWIAVESVEISFEDLAVVELSKVCNCLHRNELRHKIPSFPVISLGTARSRHPSGGASYSSRRNTEILSPGCEPYQGDPVVFFSHPNPGRETHQVTAIVPLRQTRYSARLALDLQTRQDAYKLRYDSYLTSGYIEPNEARLFQDPYDDLPNCQTIVIYDEGVPAASVRICTLAFGSGQRSPASDAFPEEVRQLLSPQSTIGVGGRGIETTRLVRSPTAENNQGLVFLLYRMAGYVGMTAHSQILLACVRRNHAPFYRRLGYQPVTEPRPYPGLNCPMQLMSCTRRRYDEIRSVYPVIDPYAGTTGPLDEFLSGEDVSVSLVAS
jgi:hypothetical protein